MNYDELGGTRIVMTDKKSFENFSISQLSQTNEGTVDAATGRIINPGALPQRPGSTQQVPQVAQAPRTQINRRMVVVGYKGKAQAWIKCFDKLFKARGSQTDRQMYLAFDPREEENRDALIDAGNRTFEKFVLIPYRYVIPQNRIGLPAPKNLDALMGHVQEEHFNGGPALMVIPFHTLNGTPFDIIEQHYKLSRTPFLGYEMVKTVQGQKLRMPGALLVFPPGWVTHPNYTLKKGLSASGGTDLFFLRDEVLRDMRTCEHICGSGQQPSSFACIQGFDTNEAFGTETVVDPNARPAGAKAVGVPIPPGGLIVTDGLDRVVRQPEVPPVALPDSAFAPPIPTPEQAEEKYANAYASAVADSASQAEPVTPPLPSERDLLMAIKSKGFAGLDKVEKAAYAFYTTNNEDFFEKAQKQVHSHKVSAGKAKKQVATASK